MAGTTDPTMTPPDPTLTAQPAKKVAPLPLAGGAPNGGTAPPGSMTADPVGTPLPSGPATTSDPLAFSNAGNPPVVSGGPIQGALPMLDPELPGGPMTPGASSPLSGFTEDQKNQYNAAQGVKVLPSGMSTYGPNATPQGTLDAANATLAAQGRADPTVSGALGKLYQPETQPVFDPAAATAQALAEHQTAMTAASTASGWNAPGTSYSGQAGHYDNTSGAAPLPLATLNAPDNPTATTARHLSPGPASDVNPSGQLPLGGTVSALPLASNAGPTGPTGTPPTLPNAGPTSTVANGTVGLTPTTPATALTNSTLSVGPTADRFKIGNDQLHSQIQNELEPQFQADERDVVANSFGRGRGVSGQNRTRLGNLELQHSRDINQLEANSNASALSGTIDDAYRNLSQADQQQGFQAGQQQTGFNQAAQLQQLADSESAQSFAEAMQQAGLGFSGSPQAFLQWIAGQYARSGVGA